MNDATRIVKATLVHQLGGDMDSPHVAYFRQGWWDYTSMGWVRAPEWEEKPLVNAVYAEQDRHNDRAIKDHKAKIEAFPRKPYARKHRGRHRPRRHEIKIVEQTKKLKLHLVSNPAVVRAIRSPHY